MAELISGRASKCTPTANGAVQSKKKGQSFTKLMHTFILVVLPQTGTFSSWSNTGLSLYPQYLETEVSPH